MSQKVLDAALESFNFVWNALTHWKLFSIPTFWNFTAVQELRGEMDIDNEHWTAASRYRKDKVTGVDSVVKKFEVVTLLFEVTQVVVTNQEGNPPPHQPTPPPIVVSLQIDQMRN